MVSILLNCWQIFLIAEHTMSVAPASSTSRGSGGSGGSGSSNSTTIPEKTDSGVSAAALGGGIAGTAAGILLLIAILFFVTRKKGWIMTRKECVILIEERLRGEEWKRILAEPTDGGIAQADGGQVYQMP
jgi:hypothetical protein